MSYFKNVTRDLNIFNSTIQDLFDISNINIIESENLLSQEEQDFAMENFWIYEDPINLYSFEMNWVLYKEYLVKYYWDDGSGEENKILFKKFEN